MGNLFRKNLQIKGVINSIHLDHKSKKTLFRQEIPESISTRKETLDIDIFITSRNGDRKIMRSIRITKKKTLWPLFMDGVQLPQGWSHFKEAVYFLPLSFQKLVLILSTSEG